MQDFDELYYRYSDQIYAYILMLVNDRAMAEDLTQDSFVRIYRRMESFRGDATLSTWMIQIARHTTIDYLRKKHPVTYWSQEKLNLFKAKENVEQKVTKNEEVNELYRELAKMKPSYREVVALRKIQELTVKETAGILGWTEGRVKMTTHRAMVKLRRQMTGKESFHEPV